MLVISLLFGTLRLPILHLLAFDNRKCTGYGHFRVRMATKSGLKENQSEFSDLP